MFQPVFNIFWLAFCLFFQKTACVFLAGAWWFHQIYGFKFPASGSVPVIFSSLELPEFLSKKIIITVKVALLNKCFINHSCIFFIYLDIPSTCHDWENWYLSRLYRLLKVSIIWTMSFAMVRLAGAHGWLSSCVLTFVKDGLSHSLSWGILPTKSWKTYSNTRAHGYFKHCLSLIRKQTRKNILESCKFFRLVKSCNSLPESLVICCPNNVIL